MGQRIKEGRNPLNSQFAVGPVIMYISATFSVRSTNPAKSTLDPKNPFWGGINALGRFQTIKSAVASGSTARHGIFACIIFHVMIILCPAARNLSHEWEKHRGFFVR